MSKTTLQKYLQQVGFDSRRTIRKQIHDGLFSIDGRTVTNPSREFDPQTERLMFRGRMIDMAVEKKSYYLLNKPYGVVTSLSDPQKRLTIKDFIGSIRERVFPVGRLDYRSEGLLLLTNDGDLTNYIISARNKIPKTYLVQVQGSPTRETQSQIENGPIVDRLRLSPFKMSIVRQASRSTWIRVTIVEGKKHIIRKTFKQYGHQVEKLRRTAIGTFRLKGIPPGHWREVTNEELSLFKKKFGWPGG